MYALALIPPETALLFAQIRSAEGWTVMSVVWLLILVGIGLWGVAVALRVTRRR